MMTMQGLQSNSPKRAPRYNVPNGERILVAVNGENLTGSLCVLSITGGTMRLSRCLAQGTLADIHVQTVSGLASAIVQFLGARKDAQAFRFVHMDTASHARVEHALNQLRLQGHGYARPPLRDELARLVRRVNSLFQN